MVAVRRQGFDAAVRGEIAEGLLAAAADGDLAALARGEIAPAAADDADALGCQGRAGGAEGAFPRPGGAWCADRSPPR